MSKTFRCLENYVEWTTVGEDFLYGVSLSNISYVVLFGLSQDQLEVVRTCGTSDYYRRYNGSSYWTREY